jgi:hypothetical protein
MRHDGVLLAVSAGTMAVAAVATDLRLASADPADAPTIQCAQRVKQVHDHIPVSLPGGSTAVDLRIGSCYLDTGSGDITLQQACKLPAQNVNLTSNPATKVSFYTSISALTALPGQVIKRVEDGFYFDRLSYERSLRWDYSHEPDLYKACVAVYSSTAVPSKADLYVVTDAIRGEVARTSTRGRAVGDGVHAAVIAWPTNPNTTTVPAAADRYVAITLTPLATICAGAAVHQIETLTAELKRLSGEVKSIGAAVEAASVSEKKCAKALEKSTADIRDLETKATELTKKLEAATKQAASVSPPAGPLGEKEKNTPTQ